MAKKKAKEQGRDAFDAWYSALFGERWPALRSALLEPHRSIPWEKGLLEPYYLDQGSAEAALNLPVCAQGELVIDLCAAPGGKSLILASRLTEGSRLIANEYSRDRRRRLSEVLNRYLPESIHESVTITGHDASQWARHERGVAQRILLDAPCSSERHVLGSPRHLDEWTAARVKNLAQRQWSLLSSAWLVLAPAGFMLYATCALSREENDGIIDRLLAKYGDEVEVCELSGEGHFEGLRPEKTTYGMQVLPDTSMGAGPLYYCLVRKALTP